MHNEVESSEGPLQQRNNWLKWGVLLGIVALGVLLYTNFGEYLSLDRLADQEKELREFQSSSPLLVYGAAFVVYVLVTGLSLPGAAALTLVLGWYFGLLRAVILVSFASTAGATIAFLLSRYFFKDAVQASFSKRLETFNQSWEKDGPLFLFTLRLIPAVPFFVINAVMGLTPIRTWTYWWVSQVGMFPGTVVYVYAGASVPDLQRLADQGVNAVFTATQMGQIITAFVLLGFFPLIARFLLSKWTGQKTVPTQNSNNTQIS